MVGSNKILTVSYGTFSCTLEGFDDSFHSMKAIAEYFRDLAQEDRYFGAEPPQPDAEMLARIAEREISRRVEAQMNEGSIRLRAAAPDAAATALATAAGVAAAAEAAPAETDEVTSSEAAEPVAEEAVAETTTDVTMPPAVEAPVADSSIASAFMDTRSEDVFPAAPTAETAAAAPGSFAAKLQRIRSVVNNADATNVAAEEIEDAATVEYGEDITKATTEDAVADAPAMADDAEMETAPAEDAAELDLSAEETGFAETRFEEPAHFAPDEDLQEDTAADAPTSDLTFEDMVAGDDSSADVDMTSDNAEVADEIPDADVEAASDDTEPTAEEDTASDDATEETFDAEVAADLSWAQEALAQADADTTADADVLDMDDADPSDEDVLSADVADADEDLSFDLNDIDLPEDAVQPTQKARIVRIGRKKSAEVVLVDAEGNDDSSDVTATLKQDDEDTVEEAVFDAQENSATEDTPEVMSEAEDATVAMDDAAEADAPVMEEEAEDAVGQSAEAADLPEVSEDDDKAHDDIRAAIADAMPAGSLSDDDEEELQRELAAVAEDVVNLDEDDLETTEVVVEGSDVTVETADDASDEDVAAEDTSEPDVAAKAETYDDDEDAASDVQDMPEVVNSRPKSRKRLPNAEYAVTRMIAQTDEALNEPAGSRRRNAIAQLKAAVAATEAARQLGDKTGNGSETENAFREDLDQVVRSSSRAIDPYAEDEAPRASPLKLVASQRVDTGAEKPVSKKLADASDVGGFAQFAASMGATELPDLLEAAAAYTSFVEGVEDFSRPQIMKKVQMTTVEEFSREDGLRSFGTLLRQGRISKVRNGRFQVSEQTRFRPDARSA